MRIHKILIALIATGAFGQFVDFAPTADGYALLFASGRVLANRPDRAQGRIYRVDPGGVHLLIERLYEPPPPPQFGMATFSNYFSLWRPMFSRDESVLAYTGVRTCEGGRYCVGANESQTTVTSPGFGERHYEGDGTLSGNGRFLALQLRSFLSGTVRIVDLATNESTEYYSSGQIATSGAIADNGTVVVGHGDLHVLKGGVTTRAVQGTSIRAATIDASGENVLYINNFFEGRASLRRYRISDGSDVLLVEGKGAMATPSISADGSRAIFLWTVSRETQTWFVNSDGSGLKRLGDIPGGVVRAALADFGRVAWLLGATGAIYRADIESGEVAEFVGRTLDVAAIAPSQVTVGSAFELRGAGFADSISSPAGFPLPDTLGGVSVRANGVSFPIISVSPGIVTCQVPWDFPVDATGNATIEVRTAGSLSPFARASERSLSVAFREAYGQFVENFDSPSFFGAYDALAVSEGWTNVIDRDHPARLGEIVHLYATGLGRVDNPPLTGMPAPVSPPARTIEPFTCYTYSKDHARLELDVLFSGLAPGMAGYYQVDLRVSKDSRLPFQFYCNGEGNPPASTLVGSVAVRE